MKIINSIKRFMKVKPYTGVPAPVILEDDAWFGPTPILSEKQREYLDMVKQLEEENQLLSADSEDMSKEVDNIHEVMYNVATKGGKTTTQLNPLPEFGGGSENFHTGPDGWKSGAGFNQF